MNTAPLAGRPVAQVGDYMTEHDAFGAHPEAEPGINPRAPTNPWHAALARFLTFTAGATSALSAILLPTAVRVPVTVVVAVARSAISTEAPLPALREDAAGLGSAVS